MLLDGEDVTKDRPSRRVRRGLGYVPQGQLCFPQMTTMENLQLVSNVKSEIDEVLDTFPARPPSSVGVQDCCQAGNASSWPSPERC